MVRKRHWACFIGSRVIQGNASGEAVAKQLLDTYKTATKKYGPQSDMQMFCRMMVTILQKDSSDHIPGRYNRYSHTSKKFSTRFKALLISCGVWLGDVELCNSILLTMKGGIPGEVLSELQEPLMAHFTKFQQLLTDALCRMDTVTDVWHCLDRYLETDSPSPQLFEWSKAVLGRFLTSTSLMAATDARTLMIISRRYGAEFYRS